MVDLGIEHVHVNDKLDTLILDDNAPDPGPEFTREINGHTVRFSPQVIVDWDADLERMTDDGINVVALFLNQLPDDAKNSDPLIHADTDIENAPVRLAAFNLDNARSTSIFVGALSLLAERYSRADKKYGWIGGYIIVIEGDSHWTWHNMGPVDTETLAQHHIQELRLAWLAVRQHHAAPGVYQSLAHSWVRLNSRAELKNCEGRDLLVRLTELSRPVGETRHEKVITTDFSVTMLALAGLDIPEDMTHRDLTALLDDPAYAELLEAMRKRCDELKEEVGPMASTE